VLREPVGAAALAYHALANRILAGNVARTAEEAPHA